MSRLLLRVSALVFVAGALAGCDLRSMPGRVSVHSSENQESRCVRRVLTRPVGNC